ncbi:F5/8 type C domain-containing protein [Kordia periserrulae]|uniref:F5/8 type C domain-containing protein n=1 Tax=Kordia periserrulae TaxID=701523 RepID=A0A2T6BZX9_9FLAO|nr:polysaccharide lyase family 7 protein [Kordia periserrulae]PTX61623.1 F5/8 type C domain-containing protein [Kordia periserrulae]
MKYFLVQQHQKLVKITMLIAFMLCFSCQTDELIQVEEEAAIVDNGKVPLTAKNGEIIPISVSANGDDGNVPQNTLDGNLGTRWSSNGYDGKYITYDLGSVKSVSSVKLAFYKGDQRKAYFKIRVGTSIYNLQTVVDKKSSGSSGNTTGLETYTFNAVDVRYVRISCFGNSSSSWNSITETEIYGSGGTNGNGDSPGDNLGLTSNDWKLNGFTGSPGPNATYRDNVLAATGETFGTYNDPNYFYTDGEWTFFKCYRGLGGSENSGNPRVELREMSNGNLASWNGGSGNNTMTFTVRVDRLPQDADNNGGVLCFAQIHGPSSTVDDVIRVQFIGDENQTSGGVRMKISGYITEDVQGSSLIIDNGYQLNTSYTFKISYNNGVVKVFDGSNEIFSQAIGTNTSGNYFKVGNYLQSVQGASYTGSHGVVRIKDLSITH